MIIFDFEIFMFDWLVVFKNVQSSEYKIIINDKHELEEFINNNKNKIFVGYNNKAFDNTILSTILSNADPYSVMLLLFKDVPIYTINKMFNITNVDIISIDLMQDILGMSLKEAEGFMKMSVEESNISFDIERKLTQEEIEDTIKYCKHDVDSTEKLLEYRQSYINSKMQLIKLFNLSIKDIQCTNAVLCSKILNAKKVIRDDEMIYDMPDTIIINNPSYKKILDLFVGHPLDYKNKLKINIAGVEHTIAYGGIHAAIDNFFYEGEMWNIDVNSFYPSMMIRYNYMSRNSSTPYLFKQIYDTRMQLKKEGKKKEQAPLKLVLNTTYGAMKSKYNSLYDPKMANQVCITGQLLFVDLIEKLEPYITLIQSNTDGILIIPKNKDKVKELLHEWEERTGMTTEIDVCNKIWQKDVNNYIMTFKNGKIKTKGGYVSQYFDNPKDEPLKNSIRIVDFALVEYFVHSTPVIFTINQCKDKYMFQYITKTGGTYNETIWKSKDGNIKVNKVNRVYASKDSRNGNLYKVKPGEKIRNDSIANLPEHCIVDNEDKLSIDDIDKEWYINMTLKRIKDFKGE